MWIGGVRAVVLDDGGRVLMLKQRHEGREIWMLPGGAIEEGENAEQAAVREVMEETGLEISVGTLLWHIEEVSEKRGQRFVNFFLAKVTGGELALGSDPELGEDAQVIEEIRFMPHDEIDKLEVLYPECLRGELGRRLSGDTEGYNPFKLR